MQSRILKLSARMLQLSLLGFVLTAAGYTESIDDADNLYHPSFLGLGPALTAGPAPVSGIINPAASAGKQRRTIELNYMGLHDLKNKTGHMVNTGYLRPSRWGNLGVTGHFFTDPGVLGMGTAGQLSLQMSRDVYPEFYLGAGLESAFGQTSQGAFGMAGNLGFVHLPGDLGPMKNLEWGMALRGIGLQPTVSPLTLGVGTSFDIVESSTGNLRFLGSAFFPTFQNIRGNMGVEAVFYESFQLQTGFHWDLRQGRSFVPTLGIGYRYNPGNPAGRKEKGDGEKGEDDSDPLWRKNSLDISSGAGLIRNDAAAYGAGITVPLGFIDETPPEVRTDYTEEKHISPNLDGVKDTLEIGIDIEDQRYIKKYTLVITDSSGHIVRKIENKEDRPENQDIKQILRDVWTRVKTPKRGIPIPEKLSWNGIGEDGSTVPDGEYTFTLYAVDDNGNRGSSGPKTFHVDNTAPSIEVSEMSRVSKIFSPDGDGNKDALTIKQESSQESLWKGEVLNHRGETVRTFITEDSEVSDIRWEGRNDEGETVPDGVYQYRVSSTDKAGNTNSAILENIIINTQSTPVVLNLDKPYISPNGDGVKDQADLRPAVPIKQGIQSWKLTLQPLTEDGKEPKPGAEIPLAEQTAAQAGDPAEETLTVPQVFTFNGRDGSGNVLSEGVYRARLAVAYENGNKPEAFSPAITIDVTPPSAEIQTSSQFLSPNNDGNMDAIVWYQDGTEELQWKGRIKPVREDEEEGEVLKDYEWIGRPDEEVQWDGRTAEGRLAAEGTYAYFLEGVDRAGNRTTVGPEEFKLVLQETEIHLTAEYSAFSPNGDSRKDVNRLFLQTQKAEDREQVDEYQLVISDASGAAVKTFSGTGRLPERVLWDGRTDRGARVPDGSYRGRLTVSYEYGNRNEAGTGEILVDTEPPSAAVEPAFTVFSPNGDGRKDAQVLHQDTSEEQLWSGEILNGRGEAVRGKKWKGEAADWTWDGMDEAGNSLPDGEYRYRLTSEDPAGNRTVLETESFERLTRQTPLFLTRSTEGFSPNSDGEKDEMILNPLAPEERGLEQWQLGVYPLEGADDTVSELDQPVWTQEGEGNPPAQIPWEGNGAQEGWYAARITMEYRHGNRPQATTSPFLLDTTAPKADIQLSPVPFSPDNDGRDDELTMEFGIEEAMEVDSWKMTIQDPEGQAFKVFQGSQAPADRITWDGRGDNGNLVEAARDYPYVLEISDTLGNSRKYRGEIPVDILVIKVGNTYRIRISSIIFKPNRGEMKKDNPEEGIKNGPTLDRLAEILKKYGSYTIRITGHAADPWYPNASEQQLRNIKNLSEMRAETVRDELVARGIDRERLSTVGKGASDPVVPHTDTANLWKNRRVEFILE